MQPDLTKSLHFQMPAWTPPADLSMNQMLNSVFDSSLGPFPLTTLSYLLLSLKPASVDCFHWRPFMSSHFINLLWIADLLSFWFFLLKFPCRLIWAPSVNRRQKSRKALAFSAIDSWQPVVPFLTHYLSFSCIFSFSPVIFCHEMAVGKIRCHVCLCHAKPQTEK